MPVNCKWIRNGQNLEATNGYNYKETGLHTRDCSITIASVGKEDIGQWKCDCEDCTNIKYDAATWIIKKQNINVIGSRNESVPEGQAVTLTCEDPVNNGNCEWRKPEFDKYEDDHHDYPAPNCTLRIKNFRKKDEGNWECVPTMELENTKPTNSINLSTTRALGPFDNGNVVFGERVILRCWFQQDVTCSWALGTKTTNPKEFGYQFIGTPRETKDCSIDIPKFGNEHVGQWVCSNRENQLMIGAHLPLNIITGNQSQPKIFLAKSKSNGENIVCVLENGLSGTDLHWKLDGKKEPEISRKETQSLDIGLYDIKITLNFTKGKFSNSTLLTCVIKDSHLSDEIKVADLQRFMAEKPEECSTNVIVENDCTSPSPTAYVIIAILSLLLLGAFSYISYPIIKKRCAREAIGDDQEESNGQARDDPGVSSNLLRQSRVDNN